MTSFEDSPKIGKDWFPVTVARTDGLVNMTEVRAILTVPHRDTGVGRLLVWVHPSAPALDVGWTRDNSDLAGNTWTIAAVDGLSWTITPERGCGCSSPLKTMPLPWGSYRMGSLL